MIKRFGEVVMIKLSDLDSNIYIVGDTAIDSGTGFNFIRLRSLLKMLKKDFKDIKQVVNTHGHFDHIGGNGFFGEAKVLIHKNDAPIIEKADLQLSAADFFDGKLHPKKVDTQLQGGETIKAGDMQLEVIHTPGHTLGSICLYDKKSGTLFSGDTVFENAIGRVDFPNSDPGMMKESLARLSGLSVKTALPGHGNPFDGKALAKVCKTDVSKFQQSVEEGEVDEDYV